MPNISITDFVDFILKTGTPKITKVAEVYNRGDYHPSHDFWKPLRDHICEFHEGKTLSLSFVGTGANSKKEARYEEAIKGYIKLLKNNPMTYFKPHRAEWKYEDLTVRINPEVGFEFGGSQYLVKLYFKQEPLAKNRIQVVFALMRAAIKSKKYKIGIVDVVRSKLYTESGVTAHVEALLLGEAATFLAIWNSLSDEV